MLALHSRVASRRGGDLIEPHAFVPDMSQWLAGQEVLANETSCKVCGGSIVDHEGETP